MNCEQISILPFNNRFANVIPSNIQPNVKTPAYIFHSTQYCIEIVINYFLPKISTIL